MYSHLEDTVYIVFCFTYVVVVVNWYILVGEEVDDDVILVMLEEYDQGCIHLCPHFTNACILHYQLSLFRYFSHFIIIIF